MTQHPDHAPISDALNRAKSAVSDRLLEISQRDAPVEATCYHVVFTGRYTLPEEQSLAKLAAFFKQGTEATRRMMQAGRTLKTYPDKAPADKLARLLTSAGAECRVEMEAETAADEPNTLQKLAFGLDQLNVPAIHLPNPRQFTRRQWLLLGAAALLLLLGVLLWAALKAPVLHGDTMAEYEASIAAMLAEVEPAQRESIQHAIALLTEAAAASQRESATTDAKTAARLTYQSVDGKSARDILAMAEARLDKKREAYRLGLSEADTKIAEAEKQLAAIAQDNRRVLDKIVVSAASYDWSAGARTPTLSFSLRNDSAENLMRVFLQGYLSDSAGTLIASNAVTYAVAGGIAPDKSAQVALPTQSDSPWAVAGAQGRQDLVFSLRVANAENQQGKSLGVDYRPMENEKKRQLAWKQKVQAELDAMKL